VGPRLEALNAFLNVELQGRNSMEATGDAARLAYRMSLLYAACWALAPAVQLSRPQIRQLGRGSLLLTGAGLMVAERGASYASICQGPTADKFTHGAKTLACGLLSALDLAIKSTVHGDDQNAVLQDCAALADAPPEQALRFLAVLTQLVGFGECVRTEPHRDLTRWLTCLHDHWPVGEVGQVSGAAALGRH